MLTGPDPNFYKSLMDRFPGVGITASGGVGDVRDIKALEDVGVPAVIVGKALYEGRIKLEDIAYGG